MGMTLSDRYQLRSHIASGGMAQVWRAQDMVLNRPVAVKILHAHMTTDAAFVARFRREAVAAARLSHASIVAIYDTVSQPGLEAIVMELIDGRTLRTILDETQVLPPATVADLGIQIASALSEAHRAGIVHRDIKPANIMISSDNRVLVTDFGIAKATADADLTSVGTLLGTAKYLSPEQVSGEPVDPRSDIYSLGVVMFEALTGRPPFHAENDAATALARLNQDPPRCSQFRGDIPRSLDDVVHTAMARDRNLRYDRAIGLKAALGAVDLNEGPGPTGQTTTDWTAESPYAPGPSHAPPPPPMAAGGVDGTAVMPSDLVHTPVTRTGRDRRGRGRKGGRRDAESVAQPMQETVQATPPPPAAGQPVTNGRGKRDRKTRKGRGWFSRLVVAAALLAGLFVAFALLSNSLQGTASVEDEAEGFNPNAGFPIESAIPIDPLGGGKERQDLGVNAIDDDVTTRWQSETYKRAALGGLKDGLGIVFTLDDVHDLNRIALLTDNTGWTADLYVLADDFDPDAVGVDAAFDPDAEGEKIGEISDGGIEERIPVDSAGQKILLWITETGTTEDDEGTGGTAFRLELFEVTVS